MTGIIEVKQELHDLIENIPEKKLYALRPLLSMLADEDDTLSEEEYLLLEECRKDRKKHPESFTLWADVKAEKQ